MHACPPTYCRLPRGGRAAGLCAEAVSRGADGGGIAPQRYLNNSAAGVIYEVFWCLVLFLVWPRRGAIGRICVGVFIATTALEFLQLWQPGAGHPLTMARSTFLGKALLGTTFSWLDIPHYALGCGLGALCMLAIARSDEAARSTDAR